MFFFLITHRLFLVDLSWLPPIYFSFDRFVVTSSSVVAVSPTRSRILNIRPCHVLIPFRIFSKGWGEGCWIMWRIWVWLHWWTIRSAGERDVKECKILYNCERFEPRSHFKSRLSLILFDRPGERSPEQPRSQGLSSFPRKMRDPGNEVESWIGLLLLAATPHKLNLLLWKSVCYEILFPIIWIKTEPIRKFSNFDFQRRKTLYQKNFKVISYL